MADPETFNNKVILWPYKPNQISKVMRYAKLFLYSPFIKMYGRISEMINEKYSNLIWFKMNKLVKTVWIIYTISIKQESTFEIRIECNDDKIKKYHEPISCASVNHQVQLQPTGNRNREQKSEIQSGQI